jgi:hypothetical protein
MKLLCSYDHLDGSDHSLTYKLLVLHVCGLEPSTWSQSANRWFIAFQQAAAVRDHQTAHVLYDLADISASAHYAENNYHCSIAYIIKPIYQPNNWELGCAERDLISSGRTLAKFTQHNCLTCMNRDGGN